jgi:hypothetical protein
MLQYLINLTAIWLLSLTIFEVFLKKETYHAYNRIYLLATFLIGIFLPFWHWASDGVEITNAAVRQVMKLSHVKQTVAVTAEHTNVPLNWQQYLWYAYIIGVVISLCLLVFQVSKIIILYQVGNRSKEGKWTVVETVKGHAPFSIFHILFVDTKEQYSKEQWDIILDHEEQHSRLWHLADQLIMQIARIIFWFHPLVYIYDRRIMLLHEYQADKISGRQPSVYGQFLVEQALLHAAPALSHSLNRSPIKTRIIMLSKTSSFLSKTKALLFLPLIFICALCFSKNQYSNKMERNGNIVIYRGNKFELSDPSPKDTVIVIDPVSGKQMMKVVQKVPVPVKMNGEKIYCNEDYNGMKNEMGTPAYNPAGFNVYNLKEYLISNLAEEFKNFPDGDYVIDLSHVVMDKYGKIVYFEYGGINLGKMVVADRKADTAKQVSFSNISPDIQKKIANKVYDLLNNAPAHSPATFNGVDVPFIIQAMMPFWNPFTIKNGKVVRV